MQKDDKKLRGEKNYGGMTRAECAKRLGLTRARIGQIERQALVKLRIMFEELQRLEYR